VERSSRFAVALVLVTLILPLLLAPLAIVVALVWLL
jgi:hypothetical protein